MQAAVCFVLAEVAELATVPNPLTRSARLVAQAFRSLGCRDTTQWIFLSQLLGAGPQDRAGARVRRLPMVMGTGGEGYWAIGLLCLWAAFPLCAPVRSCGDPGAPFANT